MVKNINEDVNYIPLTYRPIYPKEFKLPIILDNQNFSYNELIFMYIASLEFQTFIEQNIGKSIYRLSQRYTKKHFATLQLCGFIELVRKGDIYDIPYVHHNVLLLEMENYFTNIQYIAKTHKLSEYISECITRKD